MRKVQGAIAPALMFCFFCPPLLPPTPEPLDEETTPLVQAPNEMAYFTARIEALEKENAELIGEIYRLRMLVRVMRDGNNKEE